MQSKNGGFPAWEPQRAYSWIEVMSNFLIHDTNARDFVALINEPDQLILQWKKFLFQNIRSSTFSNCQTLRSLLTALSTLSN